MPRKRKRRNQASLPTKATPTGHAASWTLKASQQWDTFERWAADAGIPLEEEAAPPAWLIGCYLQVRLTDPEANPSGRTIKVKSAETIAEALKFYAKLQGWERSHLKGKATKITSVLTAARASLSEEQTVSVPARPITAVESDAGDASELDALLDHLDYLDEDPAVSEWWTCEWRAQILTGIQGPMRGGEIVTAAISNLRQATAADDGPAFVLTIPVSKWQDEPKELVFFCHCDDERSRSCPYHALSDWLAILTRNGYDGDALFPATPRYDPRLPLPVQTGPVRMSDAEGLQRLAAEIVDEDSGGSEITAKLDEPFDFVCATCATRSTETLRSRASRKYGCRTCGHRAAANDLGCLYAQTVQGDAWFADTVAERLANREFRAGRDEGERHVRALAPGLNRLQLQFKEICEGAGLEPRNEFERISLHGLKRGGVTTLAVKGVSDLDLQAFAQHRSMDTTNEYIDAHRNRPHATSYLEPWQGETDPASLGELNRLISDSQAT